MKSRILILGSTGLLGNAVTKHFLRNPNCYDVTTTYRTSSVAFGGNALYFDAKKDSLDELPHDFDYVINCIGVIKPYMSDGTENAVRLNSLFPWELARWCNAHGIGLFHITTDCVYSGQKGKYVESDLHDALDAYGKSKSLGECVSEAMVLRTSIIGEEIHKNASLIAWAKSQKGGTVGGFATHLWNGVTTDQYASICDSIIQNGWYEKGLFHVFAPDDVSKLDMLHMFNEKFHLDLTIEERYPESIDRTLRTEKALCEKLSIPSIRDMIMAL